GRTAARERLPERLLRSIVVAAVLARHADVVPGEGVARVERQCLPVRRFRLFQPPTLVRRHPALVPQLRAALLLLEQRVVQPGRLLPAPAQQRQLGQRLPHQAGVLAALQRLLELARGLLVQAALPEGERDVVVRERAVHHFRPRRTVAHELVVACRAEPVERQVLLRPRDARVELRRPRTRSIRRSPRRITSWRSTDRARSLAPARAAPRCWIRGCNAGPPARGGSAGCRHRAPPPRSARPAPCPARRGSAP